MRVQTGRAVLHHGQALLLAGMVLFYSLLYIMSVVWPMWNMPADWDYLWRWEKKEKVTGCQKIFWSTVLQEISSRNFGKNARVLELQEVKKLACLKGVINNASVGEKQLIHDKNCFYATTSQQKLAKLLNYIQNITQFLQQNDIKFFMTRGTLLGSYRNMHFVPWDDDFDVMIDEKQTTKAYEVLKKYEKVQKGSQFRDNKGVNKHWRLWSNIDDWAVDLFIYKDNGGKFLQLRDIPFSVPRSIVFPLTLRPFGHLWLPAPGNTRSYLENYYGTSMTRCVTESWNVEQTKRKCDHRDVTCDRLSHRYPFVRRISTTVGEFEFLAMHNGTISRALFYPRNSQDLRAYSYKNVKYF